MTFTTQLLSEISSKHLLKHPFYKAWNEGALSLDDLRVYARQYYHHVSAFPRYISATHSVCDNINARQILLDNLIDEEKGSENHPELWLRFAEGLGQTREEIKKEEPNQATRNLVSQFMNLSQSSFAEGLGALFAYEYQVPEVAKSKIDGLRKFYGIESKAALQFFDVHLKADLYHSEAVQNLLNSLTPEEQAKAKEAAHSASQALWSFLDSVTPQNATQKNTEKRPNERET